MNAGGVSKACKSNEQKSEFGSQKSECYTPVMIRSYEDIEAYQHSKRLYPRLVEATRSFPRQG